MVPQDLDFSSILAMDELDGANFQLPDLDPGNTSNQFAVQHPNTPFSGDMSGMQRTTAAHDFATASWDIPMDMDSVDVLGSQQGSHENLQSFQQQLGQQMWNATPQQQGQDGHMGNMVYRHPHQIPPTPNSYELHGGDAAQYQQQMAQRRAFAEQQIQHQMQMGQGKRNDFTPLVSPAVTPQGTPFQHQADFGNGAYFSPLTSPALQAQKAQQAQQAGQRYKSSGSQRTQPSTAGNSAATSPVTNDTDIEMFTGTGSSVPDRARKSTRKTNAPRSVGSRSGVRSSPVTKPQKRKSAALSNTLSNLELNSLIQESSAQQSSSLHPNNYSTDGSGAGSISPEPLSEALMGPPPRPGSGSNVQSPTLLAQTQQHPQVRMKDGNAPATPASLMSIDNPRNANNGKTPLTGSGRMVPLASLDNSNLDDFALPPSVTNNTAVDSANATPRITPARKTPKLGPLSSAGGRVSATSSPAISAMASPSSATTPQFPKDARARSSKKRGSISSSSQLISPALRPKISPSIKPLLPEGATTEQTQAFLLASKSNYTHLLEGTLLPGVSYPDSLSSGLTSKRTSHKIAEQGRRNRINEALKEMQALLPPPALPAKTDTPDLNGSQHDNHDDADIKADDSSGPTAASAPATKGKADRDSKSSKAKDSPNGAKTPGSGSTAAADAKAANSKAATVESAIVYIKTLQQERVAFAEAMKEKDREVNELRRRLREVEVNGESAGVEGRSEKGLAGEACSASANGSATGSSGNGTSGEDEAMDSTGDEKEGS
ncbi:putative phosphorus acquisition-controlling protein [Elsinoe australis]|uniref:Putative phosphorus acquisition-controlling protein n=1 Tax=Elsinoe australis TaxID=40998 RepID=A0A4U7B8R1_9PEZI|nr:putative phosphorus acquisition-controlling protein [Elsinoe australis]